MQSLAGGSVAAAAALLVVVLQISSAAAQSGGAGPPRDCPRSCGNVSVPYPFGIGARCSLPNFDLTCDRTRLLLGDGTLQVVDISLANSTVRVFDTSGAVNITTTFGTTVGNGTWGGLGSSRGTTFVVSEQRNHLVVTGCNVQATLLGDSGNVITGCSSFCAIRDSWANPVVSSPGNGAAPCSGGLGCCETSIPIGRPNYTVKFRYLEETHEYDDVLPLAVRVAEVGWFNSVATEMLNKSASRLTTPVPVVLDWAVAAALVWPGPRDDGVNSSCPPPGKAWSACRSSHSSCLNVTTNYHSGYVCRCDKGYDGNPYLDDGCQGTPVPAYII
jgi:hypothetical protein